MMEQEVCFCTDVDLLMDEIGYVRIKTEWRLFIDSGKESLKCGLLHNGNESIQYLSLMPPQ